MDTVAAVDIARASGPPVGLRHRPASTLRVWLALVCCGSLSAGLASAELASGMDGVGAVSVAGGDPVRFATDIRPLLSDRCFHCHGPDAATREGGLRLDSWSSEVDAMAAEDVVTAGDVSASSLWQRITSDDPELVMPPPESGRQLTAAEIDRLGRWIEQGAVWEGHWGFEPPLPQPVPELAGDGWSAGPIDRFVLRRAAELGLEPNRPAERHQLVRRLYLDLIGLPPTADQAARWAADRRPDAVERLVDELLANPHFGEKWGRHWLDVARYADSDGFEKDKPRFVWLYRDWVTRALNEDLDYRQFIIKQLAGDLLADASDADRIATGFLRNSMTNEEGGVDPEQFRVEALFDRLDAIGKSILGLTIACSQCHDHKYDPLTQHEYFQLLAVLNNDDEAIETFYTSAEQREREQVLRELAEVQRAMQAELVGWPEQVKQWLLAQKGNQPEWEVMQLAWDFNSLGGSKYLPQPDGSYLAQSYAPTKFEPWGVHRTAAVGMTGLRLELLTDPNLPRGGPGRSIYGTAVLSNIKVFVAPADAPDQFREVAILSATADVNPPERELEEIYSDRSNQRRVHGPVTMAIDGDRSTGWSINLGAGRTNVSRQAVFRFAEPVGFPQGTLVRVHLAQFHGGWNSDDNQSQALGRFRLSLTTGQEPQADLLHGRWRKALEAGWLEQLELPERLADDDASQRADPWRELFELWCQAQSGLEPWHSQLEEIWSRHPWGTSQLVLRARAEPRQTHLLVRGEFTQPGEMVAGGVPEVLGGGMAGERQELEQQPWDRSKLAQWLVRPESPTTGRTQVNRIWQTLFGEGLSGSPEDFGVQGDTPSHPELLDYLAADFMEEPASLKGLVRELVLSSTYQQSASVRPEQREVDATNRWLMRGVRRRLDGELVRDTVLSVSGLLDRQLGGPPIYPPAPEFLFLPPVSYGPKVWPESTGGERYRRSLYVFRFRSLPHPPLQVFDTPPGDAAAVKRALSNTPLQALTTLNEPQFVEAAQATARRLWRWSPAEQRLWHADDSGRLAWLMWQAVGRAPESLELEALQQLLLASRQRLVDPAAAAVVAGLDNPHLPPPPADVSAPELAAWTIVCRAVLNLDETISKP
jgi:hypothetical protein